MKNFKLFLYFIGSVFLWNEKQYIFKTEKIRIACDIGNSIIFVLVRKPAYVTGPVTNLLCTITKFFMLEHERDNCTFIWRWSPDFNLWNSYTSFQSITITRWNRSSNVNENVFYWSKKLSGSMDDLFKA